MKKLMIALTTITAFAFNANAQQAPASSTSTAVYAYANGDDSYLLFSKGTYKSDKKYVVFKFWNAASPLTEQEKKDISMFKNQLNQRNVEFIALEWKDESQLKEVMEKYKVSVTVKGEKHLQLKGEGFNLTTTLGKAVFVLENDNAMSVCSGKECDDRLKIFFKIKA